MFLGCIGGFDRAIRFNQGTEGGQGGQGSGGQGAGGTQGQQQGQQNGGQGGGQQQQGSQGGGTQQQAGGQGQGQQQQNGGQRSGNSIYDDWRRFVGNNRDEDAAGYRLWQDNYQLRRELEEARGRIPADGSVVLAGDQAQTWQAYQQLGAPAQLQQQLTQYQQLQRSASLAELAQVTGYNAEALDALDRLVGGLKVDYREADVQGKKVREAVVAVKDAAGADQTITLQQFVQDRHAVMLPALTAKSGQQQGQQQQQGGQQQQQRQGAGWVKQNAGGQGGGQQQQDPVERRLQAQRDQAAKETNPLMVRKPQQ